MNDKAIRFPLTNVGFLKVIYNSLKAFLNSGTSRSTEKLKPLHGPIAEDIATRLGPGYTVSAQGYGDGKEKKAPGRYFNKNVDITIEKDGDVIGGIAVKFIMQNYTQNSNNYFENMLGETANIRSSGRAYFQIIILLDRLPHYRRDNAITKWEYISEHDILKYATMSQDNPVLYFHTPEKTLIEIVHIPDNDDIKTKEEYMEYYRAADFDVELTRNRYPYFGNAVIYNDYETFIEKVYHTIKSK